VAIVPTRIVPTAIAAVAEVPMAAVVRDHRGADGAAHGSTEHGAVPAAEFAAEGRPDGGAEAGTDRRAGAVVPGVGGHGREREEQEKQGCADHGDSPSCGIAVSVLRRR
jgi:hypothetical protein